MDRVSSIFARFESTNTSRVLTSNVIGHVLPRASVGGGGVFSNTETAKVPPLRATLLSITKTQISPSRSPNVPVAPQQTPLHFLMEASISRRMNEVAACTSRSASPVSRETCNPAQSALKEEPVRPVAPSTPTKPAPRRVSRTVPSVKTIQSTAPGAPKPKRKRIRIKTPRRREQCRTNQARYRKKQMQYEKDLEVTVKQLRQEIPMLEMQHSRLISDAKSSTWCVMVEYFHLFRNGSRCPNEISSGPEAWLQKSEYEQQLVFLRSSMKEDVILGEQRGIDMLIEQWRRFTSYFDDLQFHPEHMTKISDDFIAATASLNVTISESTLQHVFPRLLSSDGNAAILRSKLLKQRLFLPCHLSFEWDRSSKRIARMENTIDILPSLVQVLGSIEDAAFVLEQALVAQDSTIGHNY
ncbi:hypothetical protein F443_01798 [Phytophthora nicotianae P1569]|uniref:BZIP domain-containing protein n=2 Tax=Phytophthora nicotianae TaxID=4792 RepID=V9FVM0_PHYNI|nr:hypothetical protein F443_01798 [Phytophthora nicotianae P1569]